MAVWGDQDKAYFLCLEAERHNLVGVDAGFYRLIRGENVDPLYDEPVDDPLYGGSPISSNKKWEFADVVTMKCTIEYQEMDDRVPSTVDEGIIAEYDARMFIAQNNWDAQLLGIDPKEGDVVYVFNEWFSVVNAGTGGNVLGTPTTTGWKLMLKRRTQHVPERKVNR